MNIGFVIPSMLRGGAERVISILCNEYAKKGNRVSLYLTEISDEISFPLHENVKIVDCTVGGKSFWSKVPGYIRILKKRFKADQLDLVVSFITRTNILSVLACNKVGIPVIISERNNPYLVPANPYFRKFRDLIYKRADGLVFQTTYARDYYGSNLSAKSAVIMNPVDIQHDVLNYKDKENVIVTACRLEKQKNVKMLIDAFSLISDKIPHYRLDIYGDGSLREELQSQIDNLKLNNKVKLLGVDKNVISKVAKAKIFALTSDFEGLSNSLAEALCVGAACVVTDSPTFGNRDLIENNQSGFITPVADADAFSAKLLELALDGDLGEKFSINAKNISGKINITSIIEQWDKYIDKVTHQSATETMATKSGGVKSLVRKTFIKIKCTLLYKLGLGCETAEMLRARGVTVGERLQNYGIIDNGHGYLVTIGDDVTISSARILTHDGSTQIWTGYSKIGRVKIGNRVFIGAGVIVLPNVEIGDDVIIGAGTVVNRDIPSNSVAVGNPVKIIGRLDKYIAKNKEQMLPNITWNTYWKHKDLSEINEIKVKLHNGGWGFDI